VSLLLLLAMCAVAGWGWSQVHQSILNPWLERSLPAPGDEIFILSMTMASFLALALAGANRLLGLGLLSKLAERVTFVLIPPLVLIFLVLGTIFLGVATPTEGGAMGALGALIMAVSRGQLSMTLLKQALDNTTRLSTFVLFILIGSTVFSFTFNAADGHIWVEHLFDKLPGGQLGFLIVVNLLVFILGMFIDFFEIAFIVIPILAPVADKMGIDLVWFGVILAMNLQTSFLTPPFGFALFYLRSVAPSKDYDDRITGQRIPAVTTAQIYKGSIAFIVLQLIMVAAVVMYPQLVSGNIDKGPANINAEDALQQVRDAGRAAMDARTGEGAASAAEDDPMKGLLDALKDEQKK
jgi:tripartite ATP-independent transporter DctM subunit